jgi:hypothetical protein
VSDTILCRAWGFHYAAIQLDGKVETPI